MAYNFYAAIVRLINNPRDKDFDTLVKKINKELSYEERMLILKALAQDGALRRIANREILITTAKYGKTEEAVNAYKKLDADTQYEIILQEQDPEIFKALLDVKILSDNTVASVVIHSQKTNWDPKAKTLFRTYGIEYLLKRDYPMEKFKSISPLAYVRDLDPNMYAIVATSDFGDFAGSEKLAFIRLCPYLSTTLAIRQSYCYYKFWPYYYEANNRCQYIEKHPILNSSAPTITEDTPTCAYLYPFVVTSSLTTLEEAMVMIESCKNVRVLNKIQRYYSGLSTKAECVLLEKIKQRLKELKKPKRH